MTSSIPSILAKRIGATAKPRHQSFNRRTASPPAAPDQINTPVVPSPSSPDTPADTTHSSNHRAPETQPAVQQPGQGEGEIAPEPIVAAVRGAAGCSPELWAALEPHLSAIIHATISSAKTPTKDGSADRQMVWRMLQVPWMTGVPRSAGNEDGRSALRSVFEQAVARVEATRRRGSVTLTLDAAEEPASVLVESVDAQMLVEHARSSSEQDSAP